MVGDVAMQASLKATLDCAEAFASTDFRPDLPAVHVPTLIIHGTHDKTVPIATSARQAAAAIAGSMLLESDGAPHGLLASHKHRADRRRAAVPSRVAAQGNAKTTSESVATAATYCLPFLPR